MPDSHPRVVLNSIVEEYELSENEGYLIILDDDYFPSEPVEYIGYYFLGDPVKTKPLQYVKEHPELLDLCPNIIVFSQSEAVTEYLESIYGNNLPRVFHAPDYV